MISNLLEYGHRARAGKRILKELDVFKPQVVVEGQEKPFDAEFREIANAADRRGDRGHRLSRWL